MVVSSTSMNVGMTTAMATIQGLKARCAAWGAFSGTLLMRNLRSPGVSRRSRLRGRRPLREGGEGLQPLSGVGALGRLPVVDVRGDRQADEQGVPVRVVVRQFDAHR